MRRLVASPRRRRRLAWLAALAAAAGAVLAIVSLFPSPTTKAPTAGGGPGWLPPPEEKPVRVRRDALDEPLYVAARFIQTAVARRHVDESWQLVTPQLRQGMTRSQWASGSIPVVPFPVREARWQLDYSFRNALGFKVALFPRRGSGVDATVFNLDLRAVGRGKKRHWLVDGFTPAGNAPPPPGEAAQVSGVPNIGGRATGTPRLGAAWIAVPFAILGLVVLVPLGVGIAQWYRGRKAEREYRSAGPSGQTGQTSSSSPS